MRTAFSFSLAMLVGALCCLCHAVFPFTFVRTGSGIISGLYDRMVVHRAKQPVSGSDTPGGDTDRDVLDCPVERKVA